MGFDVFSGSGHVCRPYRVFTVLVSGVVLLGIVRWADAEEEPPCKGDLTLCESAGECVLERHRQREQSDGPDTRQRRAARKDREPLKRSCCTRWRGAQ